MSHEAASYKAEKPRLSMLDRAKKTGVTALALVTGGTMLGGLSGCGEKAGAAETPTTPAASAPKTPEATPTPTETPIVLSAATNEYSSQITPDKLKGQTELNMMIKFAEKLPDPETDPKAYGEAMFAALNAIMQNCEKNIDPFDSDGAPRNQDNMFAECKPALRAYADALYPKADTESTRMATLVYRVLDRSSSQKFFIDYMDKDMRAEGYAFTMKLLKNTVAEDGTITISGYGQDYDGPDTAAAKKYTKTVTTNVGEDLAKSSAITRENWKISFNPKTHEYSDLLFSCTDSSPTKCS